MKNAASAGTAIAAAILSIGLSGGARAAVSRSFAEMTGIRFDFSGSGYIDTGSVQKTLSLIYDGARSPETTLYSSSAAGFDALAKGGSFGTLGATTRWQGNALSASLDVSGWPAGTPVPVTANDSPFARASGLLTGDVHLAPHASVNLSVDWHASNRSSLDKRDRIVDAAASGVSANFSSPDSVFVPTLLDFYQESAPGKVGEFSSRQTVVWTNDGDAWATAQFRLLAVADSRGYAPTPPIPEPSTGALMLSGLACIGQLTRRRR